MSAVGNFDHVDADAVDDVGVVHDVDYIDTRDVVDVDVCCSCQVGVAVIRQWRLSQFPEDRIPRCPTDANAMDIQWVYPFQSLSQSALKGV